MNPHDLFVFAALLLSGVVGSLIAGPLGGAVKVAAKRVRITDRDR